MPFPTQMEEKARLPRKCWRKDLPTLSEVYILMLKSILEPHIEVEEGLINFIIKGKG